MTDIVPYQQPTSWVALIAPTAQLANNIASTEFVPNEMRNKPDVVAACIMYGAELGLGPMQSLAKVDIVKGRPAPRAELARALALAAGHEVWTTESTNTRVTVQGKRRGSNNVQSVTWTMDDVRKAGITSGMYSKYPRQMLLARASAELVRMMCPDVLGGIAMFAEEVEAGDTEGVDTAPAQATATTKRQRAKAAIEPPPAPPLPDEEPVAELEPAPEHGPTDAQMKKMMALFRDVGMSDKAERLAFVQAVTGVTFETSKDMTPEQTSRVIDSLMGVVDGSLSLAWVDGVLSIASADVPLLGVE
jgi:hypothetical protein